MQNAISSSEEGEQVLLLMQRNGNEYTASLEPSLNPELNRRTIGVSLCRSMVTEVDKGSAAYEAGIRAGDSVLAVNGQVLYSPENVQQTLAAFQPGDEIELAVFRGQEGILLGIPPGVSAVEALDGAHLRWVEGTHVEKTRLPVWRALYVGARYTITMPMLVVDAIPLIREDPGKALVGPIGAGQLTVEAVRTFGFSNILFMASVLSLGIALFNFLPIPPLDGGGMLVAFVEGIRRGKRLSHRAIRQAHVIGTAFLITLMILISFNDILRLVQGESFGL